MNGNAFAIDDEFGPIPFDAATQSARDLCSQEQEDWMRIFAIDIDLRE